MCSKIYGGVAEQELGLISGYERDGLERPPESVPGGDTDGIALNGRGVLL